ncbi:hypothetical protein A1O1_05704 [Capronia coronata CBS 617.96]|uniref:Xylanolytic transcriptional activator regulatory domain-containing protein n=1 Tax=Capronia coronata CBS 617.96 TaxID=1182541 RepID=W9Y6W7_9EURO|nr:uncharacterized protein A1O1_05704 [Capronia coronata CBS 617.96]EXJ85340.1 hypothetical protein A1O1_05704 [Capronia coronata CBS 617.96]
MVEDPSTKRYQPRNYLELLERRVAYLEQILKQSRPDLADDHLLEDNAVRPEAQSPTSTIPTQSVEPQYTEFRDDDEHDRLDDLASQVGLLSLNAAGAEPHYLGSSSTFAFSRVINSSLRQVVLRKPSSETTGIPNQEGSATLPTPCLLPTNETAIRLSNAYFQNVHSQYPFLHEPTFRSWEATLASASSGFNSLISNPVALFFLNMVYAIGALLLPSSEEYSAERLYISAQLYVDHILSRDNLEAIQAILCCAVYSVRSSIGTSHWKLAGLALRQCIDLGYHRDARRLRSATADPLQMELRKRVFWCAYVMECQAAVMLGRPLGLPYQEVDAEYPMDIDDSYITNSGIYGTPRTSSSEPPTSMTKAILTFRIRRLLGQIHTSIYSKVAPCSSTQDAQQKCIDHLRNELEQWRASIPPEAPETGQTLALFTTPDWFRLEYDYTLLQLYRVQITDHKDETPDSVFIDCLEAAEHQQATRGRHSMSCSSQG